MSDWDVDLYMRFGEARTRPAIDLAARVDIANPGRIIDIGCGPGNSTAILRSRWPDAVVTGLDSSPEMIDAARKNYPGQEWILSDAASWQAQSAYDIVFSNAALQWVPRHNELLPRLFSQVSLGGALAFQIPSRASSRIHELILEVAGEPQWADFMAAAKNLFAVEKPSYYYDLLAGKAGRLDIWETEYCHVMQDRLAIVQWIKGTSLRPFLEVLPVEEQKQRFVGLLANRLMQVYPLQKDGKILFPFRRLFVVAYS